MTPVDLLVTLLVVILLLGLAFWAVGLMPIDAEAKRVLYVIVAVAAILGLLRWVGLI